MSSYSYLAISNVIETETARKRICWGNEREREERDGRKEGRKSREREREREREKLREQEIYRLSRRAEELRHTYYIS